MGAMYILLSGVRPCRHFSVEEAKKVVDKMHYTTSDGVEHHGGHWTLQQIIDATAGQTFGECVTDGDKLVAYNATYADLNKVLDESNIIRAASAFWFNDEDAPCDKIYRYVTAMR